MSLTVPEDILEKAQNGDATPDDGLAVLKESLPYPVEIALRLKEMLEKGDEKVCTISDIPNEAQRGQLLRALASDALRLLLEEKLGLKLAFANCHHVSATRPNNVTSAKWQEVISLNRQLALQSPEERNC